MKAMGSTLSFMLLFNGILGAYEAIYSVTEYDTY